MYLKRQPLAHSDLEVSTFCLGCMPMGARVNGEAAEALLHRFRDAGGHFVDTAHCYSFWEPCGDGASERILGRYFKQHGGREQWIIGTKGGHPSVPGYRTVPQYLSAERVAADIDDSLGRLQVDTIDLYWLHRDDPRLDVGAILDTLNREVQRGRIRWFGASNWTSARLDAANRYAQAHGIRGFVASQPRWSLMQYEPMPEPKRLEPGVLLHVNDEDRRWHAASRLPVIPYGPTGNGFFARQGQSPEKWHTEPNLLRAQRACSLAAELGATPNQVALAWLLHQPFPVVPILGTSNLDHLDDALAAADLRLTAEQCRWLELGDAAAS